MGGLNGGVRKLRDALEEKEPAYETLVADTCRLQALVVEAKSETLATLAAVTDVKKLRKAAVEDRLEMHELLRALLEVEAGLLEENAKAAGKALRELDKLKSSGHGKFKEGR